MYSSTYTSTTAGYYQDKRRNSEAQLHRKRPYKALSHSPNIFDIITYQTVNSTPNNKRDNSPSLHPDNHIPIPPPHVNGLRQPLIFVSQACCVGVFPAHRGTRQGSRQPPHPRRRRRGPAAPQRSSSLRSTRSAAPTRRSIHDASRPQHAYTDRVARVLRLPAARALPARLVALAQRLRRCPRHGLGPLRHRQVGLGVPCVCGRDGGVHVGHRDVSA